VREGDITRIARDTPYGAGVTGSEQIEIAWLGDPGNVSSATRLDTWNGTN
jgi:hypothetical protein